MVAQAATNLATVYGLNASDVSQTVTLAANVPLNGFAGLVSRYNAAGTAMYQAGLAAAYDATRKTTTYSAQIWLVVGTKRTLLVSKPVAVGSGRLTFATVRGSLELFLNNTLVAVAADTTLKSGSIGLNATKGSQFSNFTAAAPALTAATLPFTDSFTSGTVPGASWYSDLGGFGVAAGTLTGLAGANEMTLYGVSQQNASVQAQLTALAANTSAGLLARYNASTGDTLWAGLVSSYDAVHKTTTYSAQIRQRVGGVWRTLLTITTGVHPGLLRFDVSGSQLSLYLDGNLVGKITGTLLSAGSVGLAGDLGSKWTAFSAKGL